MLEVETKVREWGRSLGVVLPKDKVKEEKFKAGDSIRILIMKRINPIQETFGTLKLSRSTDEILKEVDEEGWDD